MTSPHATDPMPSDLAGGDASRARVAALIGAAGLATYFAYVVATRHIFLFDVGSVAPLFCTLIATNLVLAATARRWASWRRAIYVYQALQVVACTVILHRLGGVMMGSLLITYAFPVILAEMFGSDAGVFVTANVSASSYAAMAWVERAALSEVGIDTDQQVAFVVFAFLVLNFLALYTNRYGRQLRNLAHNLSEKVAERTAELTAVNAELAANARALEAKQEELRTFVYAVTHDLKSPLSAILLTADLLLQRDGTFHPEARAELERIAHLADGTEDMIRDLLELFRITSLPEACTWVELDALVAEALERLRPQITAKRIQVAVAPLPRVWGQPRKLAHVVSNLLGNAVKYVPAGRGEIEVSGTSESGSVLLRVRDNGIGIAQAYHRGIFELFGRVPEQEQTVDGERVGGTGVGLAIVKRIVEAHRGSVTVVSTPGAGSDFEVRMPGGGA
jgi:signal transduction histidine kinase